MASAKNNTYGIEIRKNLITIVQYSPSENTVGSIVIKPLDKEDDDGLDTYLGNEFKKITKEIELRKRKIVLSLPAQAAIIRKISIDSDEPETDNAIRWELSQSIPGHAENFTIDYEPMNQAASDGIKEYIAVAYKTSYIRRTVSVLKASKLSPAIADIDLFALINVFTVNYPELSEMPALLILGAEDATSVILSQNGTVIDYEIFPSEAGSLSPEEYASRLNRSAAGLCGRLTSATCGTFYAGSLFMHAEFVDAASKIFQKSEILNPFKKIACKAADEKGMAQFAPQLAVAVGLALRGLD
jgi:Tfp pilus assembly PilM family ATPase